MLVGVDLINTLSLPPFFPLELGEFLSPRAGGGEGHGFAATPPVSQSVRVLSYTIIPSRDTPEVSTYLFSGVCSRLATGFPGSLRVEGGRWAS